MHRSKTRRICLKGGRTVGKFSYWLFNRLKYIFFIIFNDTVRLSVTQASIGDYIFFCTISRGMALL